MPPPPPPQRQCVCNVCLWGVFLSLPLLSLSWNLGCLSPVALRSKAIRYDDDDGSDDVDDAHQQGRTDQFNVVHGKCGPWTHTNRSSSFRPSVKRPLQVDEKTTTTSSSSSSSSFITASHCCCWYNQVCVQVKHTHTHTWLYSNDDDMIKRRDLTHTHTDIQSTA